jgi:uncharacterized protein (TIGR02246 family)
MKNIIVFTLVFCTTLFTGLSAQQSDPAVATVHEAITTFFAYDAVAYGNFFAEDGELINPMGMRMQGRPAMIQSHVGYFESLEGQTGHASFSAEKVQYLSPTIAAVTLNVDANSTNAAGEEVDAIKGAVMAILKKDGDNRWMIHFFQVTPVHSFAPPTEG